MMVLYALLLIVMTPLGTAAQNPASDLFVEMKPDGSYSVGFKGEDYDKVWFDSGPTMITQDDHPFSTEDGSLLLQEASHISASDVFGTYEGMSYQWTCGKSDLCFATQIRRYEGQGLVQFDQVFLTTVKNSEGSAASILSSFPTIYTNSSDKDIGFMTYSGAQVDDVHFGVWNFMSDIPGGLDGGMPLVLFDSKLRYTMVLSASSEFMASNQALLYTQGRDRVFGFGVLGSVTYVPTGFMYTTMLYVGGGVTDSMIEWGGLLLKYYNKTSVLREKDKSINYLGYWTDNGACYYYYKGDFPNNEDTMVAVHEDAVNSDLPFAYLQLDSWWYYKGYKDGVKNWTANSTIFPDGVEGVAKRTGWPLVAHNKFWSTDTDYAKQNGGKFDFIIGETESLPNSAEFWYYLLYTARNDWNVIVYEQDWLHVQTGEFEPLKNSVTLGKDWLTDMGTAAFNNDITIQYCSAFPRHLLQSVSIPAVTQTRVSGDYHPGGSQWHIGDTTLLAHSLGLAAFKDTFHTTSKETKCEFTDPETAPVLETVVASLSGGPVGPSDSISQANSKLIMSTCMKDGRLLKPTRPAMSHDLTYVQRAFQSSGPKGELWVGYTIISGYVYYYILAAEIEESYSFTWDQLPTVTSPAFKAKEYVAYTMDYFHGNVTSVATFSGSSPISIPVCGETDFKLWILAPIVTTNIVFLGEMTKVVSVSETRFHDMRVSGTTTTLTVAGSAGETVYVAMLYSGTRLFNLKYGSCVIPQSGQATWTIPFGKCQ